MQLLLSDPHKTVPAHASFFLTAIEFNQMIHSLTILTTNEANVYLAEYIQKHFEYV